MDIKFIPLNTMKDFHNNENVLHLLDLCISNIGDRLFDDVLYLIRSPSLAKAKNRLEQIKYIYSKKDEMSVFDDLKDTIVQIYSHEKFHQLKGAFLEVLSFNIFKRLYPTGEYCLNCNVLIDDWNNHKEVDIGIKCEEKGIISECKTSRRRFNKTVLGKLLEIKNKSEDYFSLFIITLDNKSKICQKLDEISYHNQDLDLSGIYVIHRNNFSRFCSGSFDKYVVNDYY